MAANVDRGEFELHIGGQSRTLRFRAAECMVLEERLGADPLAFIARGGGQTKFLVEAIFAGLSREKTIKLTPAKVAGWLDDAEDLDRSEVQKEILYAIARGKPGEEGIEMVKALDDAFGASGNPTKGGQRPPTAETRYFGRRRSLVCARPRSMR